MAEEQNTLKFISEEMMRRIMEGGYERPPYLYRGPLLAGVLRSFESDVDKLTEMQNILSGLCGWGSLKLQPPLGNFNMIFTWPDEDDPIEANRKAMLDLARQARKTFQHRLSMLYQEFPDVRIRMCGSDQGGLFVTPILPELSGLLEAIMTAPAGTYRQINS